MSQRALPPLDDGALFLTDAGMETALIFHQGQELPSFATFPLLESEAGRDALRTYYEPFLELARTRGTGFILGGCTWRASADWGAELGLRRRRPRGRQPPGDGVRRGPARQPAGLVAAGRRSRRPIGPRGDAYAPSSLMTAKEAEQYHSAQMQTLSDTPVELITALTFTYADEAIGLTRAANAAGLPVAVSFTVETDGRLPSGQTLRAAIEQVDGETDGAPLHYMINCAHPTHFAGAVADGGPWSERIQGLRANASTLSHAELDEAEDLDDGDPGDLAARHLALRGSLPNLSILGGCCGTDIRHVTCIADAWLES